MQTDNPRQQQKKTTEGSVQAYLEIAEIRDDILVMKDGSLRAVLMTSSLNFELKSPEEQEAIIGSYQNFLNSLNFPLQILVRSKKLVLDNYLYLIKERYKNETSQFIKNQLDQYYSFLTGLLEVSQIMDKQFYVVIPLYPGEPTTGIQKIGFFQKIANSMNPTWIQQKKEEEFQLHKTQLMERVELTVSELSNIGLNAAQLKTKDLIELFYEIYNFETSQREKLIDVEEVTANVIK